MLLKLFWPGFGFITRFYVRLLGESINMIQKLTGAVLDGGKETNLVTPQTLPSIYSCIVIRVQKMREMKTVDKCRNVKIIVK